MRAEFVRALDGEVAFLKDGKVVTIPLARLSERDRQIVQDLAAGKPVADEAPSPAAKTAFALQSEQVAAEPSEEQPKSLTKKAVPIVERVWSDVHGNQVTAKFVRVVGGNVVLGRGSRSVFVAFGDLSFADQEYVKEVLTSRGQEGLIPRLPAAAPATDAGQNQAAPVPATAPSAPFDTSPSVGRGQIFDELQQRDQEQRQELAQQQEQQAVDQPQAGTTPTDTTSSDAAPQAGDQTDLQHGNADAKAAAKEGGAPLWSPETYAEVREMVIIGLVIVGVIGMVGFMVWVGMTIAQKSSVSHQRRYF
jgi:hypothetical protein